MNLKKILFLLLYAFVYTGCMPKQADGKYRSKYSYHPYYKLYRNRMIKGEKKYKYKYSYHNSNRSNSKTKISKKHAYKRVPKRIKHRIKHNNEELYPSNVPASSNY